MAYKSGSPVVGCSSSSSLDERKPSESALMLSFPSLPFSGPATSSFFANLAVHSAQHRRWHRTCGIHIFGRHAAPLMLPCFRFSLEISLHHSPALKLRRPLLIKIHKWKYWHVKKCKWCEARRTSRQTGLTFHFCVVGLGLPHEERCCLPIQGVCGVGVQQQLWQECLKDIQQVCKTNAFSGNHFITHSTLI